MSLAGAVLPVVLALAQEPQPSFRSRVDLIAVDVDIVDHNGGPVSGLRPDQFQVSIDGKARKVVSADFVSVTTGVSPSEPRSWSQTSAPIRPAATSTTQPGRVYILAFDAMSFPALGVAPAREATHAFVDRLQPHDLVGLIVFPMGPTLDVTTDRARLFQDVDRLVGSATPPEMDPYRLTPSEMVDLTYLYAKNDAPMLQARVREICALTRDPEMCLLGTPPRLVQEAIARAQFEEMEIAQRLGALQSMFKSLAASPRRKVVVLISAGLLVTDRPGGRPDLEDIGRLVGQGAAEANASVYALHFDRLLMDRTSASSQGINRRSDFMRDSAIFARPLDQIAGASGGAFFNVVQGGGEFALNRILNETSAYYLLGVEPAEKDRDGRSHQLRVKVAQKDVTVRGRSWVTLPKLTVGVPVAPGSNAVAAPGEATPPRPSAAKPLPESVRGLTDAYARTDYGTAGQLLSRVADLANVIHDFRAADPPWPNTPHRERVFALELALAGLANRNAFARDEGTKLLTQTHLLVEQAVDADAFACEWFRAEAAGLEGLWQPDVSLPFVQRASRRCVKEPRLSLARAVLLEQGSWEKPDPIRVREVLDAYQAVDTRSAARLEALVRAAWFVGRTGDVDRALELVPAAAGSSPDPYVRFVFGLVKGHLLRAPGRVDEAAAAYRQALLESPGAQSARVALMTLLLSRGDQVEAAALAEAIQTAGTDQADPWWIYSRGDFRSYTAIIARLREAGQ